MPQEFQVLQCYKCQTFQVHQVKKTLKWACKLCGEKQSIKKVYGRGTGAECRQHVQSLNTLRGQMEQTRDCLATTETGVDSEDHLDMQPGYNTSDFEQASGSKWQDYVEDEVVAQDDDHDDGGEELYTTDARMAWQSRKKLKRKSSHDAKVSKRQQPSRADSWQCHDDNEDYTSSKSPSSISRKDYDSFDSQSNMYSKPKASSHNRHTFDHNFGGQSYHSGNQLQKKVMPETKGSKTDGSRSGNQGSKWATFSTTRKENSYGFERESDVCGREASQVLCEDSRLQGKLTLGGGSKWATFTEETEDSSSQEADAGPNRWAIKAQEESVWDNRRDNSLEHCAQDGSSDSVPGLRDGLTASDSNFTGSYGMFDEPLGIQNALKDTIETGCNESTCSGGSFSKMGHICKLQCRQRWREYRQYDVSFMYIHRLQR